MTSDNRPFRIGVLGHGTVLIGEDAKPVERGKIATRDLNAFESAALADLPHVEIVQNNGKDLAALGNVRFDFVFSSIVFQHIPSREVIESYVRDVYRLLRRGRLFKFQVQGGVNLDETPDDTWLGAPFSEQEARNMAARCGFEMRYNYGAGSQYFWLWYFKPKLAPVAWWYRERYALRGAYRRWRGRLAAALKRG